MHRLRARGVLFGEDETWEIGVHSNTYSLLLSTGPFITDSDEAASQDVEFQPDAPSVKPICETCETVKPGDETLGTKPGNLGNLGNLETWGQTGNLGTDGMFPATFRREARTPDYAELG